MFDSITKPEAQEAVNTIKDMLLESRHRIEFPLCGDLVMKFTLSRSVTKKQWDTILEVIKLAEASCVLPDATATAEATP